MKKYFLKIKTIIGIKIITAALSILFAAFIPLLTKKFIDGNLEKKEIINVLLLYFICIIGYLFFERISQRHAWKLDQKFSILAKRNVINAYFLRDSKKINKETNDELFSIIQNDIPFLEEMYIENSIAIIQTSIQLIIYSSFLLYLDYRILILVIILTLISIMLPNVTSKKLSFKKNKHLSALGKYIAKINDHLLGIDNVNENSREKLEKNINDNLEKAENQKIKYGFYKTFTNIFLGGFAEFIKYFIFILVIILAFYGSISKGDAIASIIYSAEFLFPLSYLTSCINNIKSTKETKEKFLKWDNVNKQEKKQIDDFKNINFVDVNVKFEKFQITNLNLNFNIGQKYLIKGDNGSGKSTVQKILLNKIAIDSGKVLINENINIDEVNLYIC